MAYVIIFLFGISGISQLQTVGLTDTTLTHLGVALAGVIWIILDRYRSENRSESCIAGFVFFICGAAALSTHLYDDHGFFFWAGVLGTIMGAVTYPYEVFKQIKQKRARNQGLPQ